MEADGRFFESRANAPRLHHASTPCSTTARCRWGGWTAWDVESHARHQSQLEFNERLFYLQHGDEPPGHKVKLQGMGEIAAWAAWPVLSPFGDTHLFSAIKVLGEISTNRVREFSPPGTCPSARF